MPNIRDLLVYSPLIIISLTERDGATSSLSPQSPRTANLTNLVLYIYPQRSLVLGGA